VQPDPVKARADPERLRVGIDNPDLPEPEAGFLVALVVVPLRLGVEVLHRLDLAGDVRTGGEQGFQSAAPSSDPSVSLPGLSRCRGSVAAREKRQTACMTARGP
jgi:hypothetical protein